MAEKIKAGECHCFGLVRLGSSQVRCNCTCPGCKEVRGCTRVTMTGKKCDRC